MQESKLTGFHFAALLILAVASLGYFLSQEREFGAPATSDAGRPNRSAANISEASRFDENKPPEISADSALVVLVELAGEEKILFRKASAEILPMASVVKLMTALVVIENFSGKDVVVVSQQAVNETEDAGNFRAGEKFFADDLLRSLLTESSNDAAAAFAEALGRKKFVELVNERAKKIGLENTRFTNPTGLDAGDYGEGPSRSTAEDLVKLARYLMDNNSEIFEISATESADLYDAGGAFHHRMKNTNELVISADFPAKILGGKTGETPLAGQALLLVTEGPAGHGYVVSVVLKSRDRFKDMKELLRWVYAAAPLG